jgi:hypothetical protein
MLGLCVLRSGGAIAHTKAARDLLIDDLRIGGQGNCGPAQCFRKHDRESPPDHVRQAEHP